MSGKKILVVKAYPAAGAPLSLAPTAFVAGSVCPVEMKGSSVFELPDEDVELAIYSSIEPGNKTCRATTWVNNSPKKQLAIITRVFNALIETVNLKQ